MRKRLQVGVLVLTVVSTAVVGFVHHAGTIHAAGLKANTQSKPRTDWSYYISYLDDSRAYTLGCNQGNSDKSTNPALTSEVILDFGDQQSGATGTYLVYSNTPASNAQVESMAESFAHGYWACTSSASSASLTLDIGTNNSPGGDVSYAAGSTWADVVETVQSYNHAHGYDSRVTMEGANDIEVEWSSASAAEAWANGFSSHARLNYVDFGDAGGCSPSGCNNHWTYADVAYVSWGAADALAAPQIYNDGTAQEWGYLHNHGGPAYFEGPLDQGINAGNGVNFDSQQAWSALGQDSGWATMLYSMEIHCEIPPAPTPTSRGCQVPS